MLSQPEQSANNSLTPRPLCVPLFQGIPMRLRQAFTLIELLVVMALITLIMAIISQAFVDGLETFRQLKGLGDLSENLRSAVVPLREDLIKRHLYGGTGLIKLSDPAPPQPTEGYFRIE